MSLRHLQPQTQQTEHCGAEDSHQHHVIQLLHLHLQEAQHHQLQVLHGGAQQLLLRLQGLLPGPDGEPGLLLLQVHRVRLLGILRQEQCGQESGQQTIQYVVQTIQVRTVMYCTILNTSSGSPCPASPPPSQGSRAPSIHSEQNISKRLNFLNYLSKSKYNYVSRLSDFFSARNRIYLR